MYLTSRASVPYLDDPRLSQQDHCFCAFIRRGDGGECSYESEARGLRDDITAQLAISCGYGNRTSFYASPLFLRPQSKSKSTSSRLSFVLHQLYNSVSDENLELHPGTGGARDMQREEEEMHLRRNLSVAMKWMADALHCVYRQVRTA